MEKYYISSNKYNLQERQTKRGKVYDVVFRIVTFDGEEKQKRLSGFANKTLAKQGYVDFVTEKCELVKNNPLKKKNLDKSEPTVEALLTEYLLSLSNQNKYSSIYDKNNIYNLFILPKYRNEKITIFTREELYRWQDELWQTKNPRTKEFYSFKYLSKIRGHLYSFLTWCDTRYGIPNNMPYVKKPKNRAPKKQMQIWAREDFEKFIAVVDNEMYHALFTLMFFTGRRKGELFALTKNDIKKDTIIFDKSLTRKTLNGSSYEITSNKTDKINQATPICKVVKEELKKYKGGEPFFFGGEKPLAENTVTRMYRRYCEKANIKPIRIHDLRHSFASMLIHLSANYMVVADLIGDTPEQVIKTYGHLYNADKIDIINKLV